MYIDYDLQKINTALADFYNATGIDMNILKSDFSPLSDNRLQNCQTGKLPANALMFP